MSAAGSEVLVIGAGVSGLTTGVRLAEQGYHVRIRAERMPQWSTSFAAGAIWDPVVTGSAVEQQWSRQTYEAFSKLEGEQNGVRFIDGTEASRDLEKPPEWAADLPGHRDPKPPELPDGFTTGWRYTAPVIDMPVYLGYLVARLSRAGVRPERVPVLGSLDDVLATTSAAVVVNCAGAGARELVPDPAIVPVRGQLVIVRNSDRHFTDFFAEYTGDSQEMTYVLPHGDHLVLGGNAVSGASEPRADPEVAEGILRRCRAVFPGRIGEPVGHRVGIRPWRGKVCLEPEMRAGGVVVHNYGHGGVGVSLSWGCADAVTRLVRELL